jgi:hypothetical protein
MTAQTNFASLGKNELRALCKEHGIKNYGKMTNDMMRDALSAMVVSAAEQAAPEVVAPTETAAPEVAAPTTEEEEAPAAPSMLMQMFNPIVHAIPQQAITVVRDGQKQDDVAKQEAPAHPASPKAKGYKIEKAREERNGIKRPSAGGACRAVWDELDAAVAGNVVVTAKWVKELAISKGWNLSNASIEFYQWRKFNGIGKV